MSHGNTKDAVVEVFLSQGLAVSILDRLSDDELDDLKIVEKYLKLMYTSDKACDIMEKIIEETQK